MKESSIEKSRDRTPEARSFGLNNFYLILKESYLMKGLFNDRIGNFERFF
jgi:hypothetical protein